MSPVGVTATAIAIAAAASSAVSSVAAPPAPAPSAAVNGSQVAFPELAHFFSNNTQWAAHTAQDDPSFFPTLNASQHPGIVWIGCSDSRVPESVITQQNPGSIFTHRNIANQIHADDWSAQAVVEYATGHLDVEHVIVVGHTNCGGAAAAFAAPNPDASANATETPENMCPGNSSEGEGKGHGDGHGKGPKEPKEKEQKGSHGRGDGTPVEGQCACFTPDQVEPGTEPGLDQFLAPLIRLRHSLPAGATVQDLIVANVRQSVDVLASSNAITNQWLKQKRVCVHGWLYDIGTGLLKDLEFSRCE